MEPVMEGKQEMPDVKPEVPLVAASSSSSGVKRSQEDAGITDREVVPPTPTLPPTLAAPKPEDVLPPVRAQLTYGNRTCQLSPPSCSYFSSILRLCSSSPLPPQRTPSNITLCPLCLQHMTDFQSKRRIGRTTHPRAVTGGAVTARLRITSTLWVTSCIPAPPFRLLAV
jgi:hypothetical protein